MPLYFFDIHDHDGLHRDEVGEHCDDGEGAAAAASFVLADAIRDTLPAPTGCRVCCEVRDETGHVVFRGEMAFTSSHPHPGA